MKCIIWGYEVEIKAKRAGAYRSTEKDTVNLLNYLSALAGEAAHQYDREGYSALAKDAGRTSKEIYELLDSMGVYD